jgi:hypothetical protein
MTQPPSPPDYSSPVELGPESLLPVVSTPVVQGTSIEFPPLTCGVPIGQRPDTRLRSLPPRIQHRIYRTLTIADSHAWRCVCRAYSCFGRLVQDLLDRLDRGSCLSASDTMRNPRLYLMVDEAIALYATQGLTDKILEAVREGGRMRAGLLPALQHGQLTLYHLLNNRCIVFELGWCLHAPSTVVPIQHGLLPDKIEFASLADKQVAMRLAALYGQKRLIETIIAAHGPQDLDSLLLAGIEGAAEAGNQNLTRALKGRLPPRRAARLQCHVALGQARGGHLKPATDYGVDLLLLIKAAAQGNQRRIIDYLRPSVFMPSLQLAKNIFYEGAGAGHLAMIWYAEEMGYIYSLPADLSVLENALCRDDAVVFEYLWFKTTWDSAGLVRLCRDAELWHARQVFRLLLSPQVAASFRGLVPSTTAHLVQHEDAGRLVPSTLLTAYTDILAQSARHEDMGMIDLVLAALVREYPQEAPVVIRTLIRTLTEKDYSGARRQKILALMLSYLPRDPA